MVLERRGRDRLYIIAEILAITKDGSLKTQVMYRANLSFKQLNDYLSFLLKRELIEVIEKNKKNIYKTTPKGIRYLENYEGILNLLMRQEPEWKKETPLLRIGGRNES